MNRIAEVFKGFLAVLVLSAPVFAQSIAITSPITGISITRMTHSAHDFKIHCTVRQNSHPHAINFNLLGNPQRKIALAISGALRPQNNLQLIGNSTRAGGALASVPTGFSGILGTQL